ncbi:ATP-binding cassette sub-family B member 5 [Mus musculus]|uniref:ATP-binding cassette sub-family B member 5 n=3 Tax=Mus musculus TaxID=10090 RepID=ABCB5_MOUSE|nr:ATP-binding cassette sub-family B member 5 [Mus musculus]B5X0E4.1 RecName: Full=ATP-binding cassette sub-family B member 5; AltName: Full=ABCB5 P-gp; AltName: Full=P-glycoprotein ABCB5 [Mus musculus]AAX11686.1 ATP-binding cassette sub-family B member 5 variant [Mus musculus]|eukprot:NP_084237.1 ATP-binding cassette sub-family B member 5 [Mus musculus]
MANSERTNGLQETNQRYGPLQEQVPKVGNQAVGPIEIFRFADNLDIVLMTLGILASMINGATVPLMSLVLGEISDHLINGCLVQTNRTKYQNCSQTQEKLNEDIIVLTLYYIGIGAAALIFGYVQISFWVITAARQTTRIRKQFFHSILAQDISWFDGSDICELNTRMTGDINKLCDGIGDKIPLMFQNISGFSIGLVISLIKSWKLSLVVLSTSPLIMASSALCSRMIISLTSKELDAYSKAGAVAEEALSSIQTVTAFGAQEKEIQRYTQHLKDAKDAGIKRATASKLSLGAVYFFMNGAYGLAFWYGTSLIFGGEPGYTIGTILAVFFSVIHSSYCIGSVAPHLETFTVARGAAFNIFQVIDKKPNIDNFSTAGFVPECIEGNIEFKNVSFSYPSRPSAKVLKGLNLKIKAGETVALVGPSGSGKSTTVQLLQRLYDPEDGCITVDENDIRAQNVRHYREQIGVVRQEPVLFGTTIGNNIKFGREGVGEKEMEQAAREANAYDFIMAFPKKFNTLVGEKGAQMSGGQKQRIAIARALVRNPKILILDEATSALDTESESLVQTALEKASKGRTTIVVAHRLSTIRGADLIVTMKDGMVVEKGTHAELMAKQGLYYSLAMAQDIKKVDEQMESRTCSTAGNASYGSLCDVNSAKAPCTDQLEEAVHHQKTSLPEVSLLKIFKLSKSEWPFVVLGTLASALNGSVHPVFSIIFGKLVTMFEDKNKATLKQDAELYSMMLVVLGIVALVTYLMQGLFYGRAEENLAMRLRHSAFKAMLYQDMAWYDDKENNTGALTTTLAVDVAQIQGAATSRLGIVTQDVSNMSLSILISFIYGWEMTLLILSFAPVLAVTGMIQTAAMAGFANRDKQALKRAGKIATEAVENIRTVVSLTRERAFEQMYEETLQTQHRNALKRAHITGCCYAVSHAFVHFAHAAGFRFGAYLIQAGRMMPEGMFIVFTAIAYGAMAIGETLVWAPEYSKAKAGASHLFALLKNKPTINSCSQSGEKPDTCEGNLEFREVSFVYPCRPEVPVLQNMSLSIEKGKTVAFVGSSGCGKSTCVQLLQRFYDPMKGQVLLDGVDVKELNVQWLRSQTAIVSQEPVLFNCSIAENIAYGDNSRMVPLEEIKEVADAANIHSFIEGLPRKYNTLVGLRGVQLSGGQKQRLAIARALLRKPKILLLDEATSALDNESEKVVQQALDKARRGKTCLVVAHRLSTIQNADMIVVLQNGSIKEQGTHQELLRNGDTYFKLVAAH